MKKLSITLTIFMVFAVGYAQYTYHIINSEPESKRIEATAVDNSGNTIVTGTFRNTLNFGIHSVTHNYTIPDNHLPAAFIVKMSPGGSFTWAKSFKPTATGGPGPVYIEDVSTDAAGNIYLTGSFKGKVSFGTITLTSKKSGPDFTTDIFTAKMNASGTVLWVKQEGTNLVGCNAGESGSSVISDNVGNVYMTGSLIYKVFKNTTVCNDVCHWVDNTTRPVVCAYVVKYNSSGTKSWEKKYFNSQETASDPCSPNITGSDISTDGTNIFVAGRFKGLVQFGNISLNSGGASSNTFLLKLNTSGSTEWAQAITGSNNEPYGVANNLYLDPGTNDLFVSGVFHNGSISFDDCLLSTTASTGYIFKVTSSGTCVWGQRLGNLCYGAVRHPNGNLVMLLRKGLTTFGIKQLSMADGTTMDSIVMEPIEPNTQYISWDGLSLTPDGFVFSQHLNGSYDLGGSIISSITPPGGSNDLMLIRYSEAAMAPPANVTGGVHVEYIASDVSLYPNPVENEITLRNTNQKILGEIAIYNTMGRRVLQKFISGSETSIDVADLPAGIYLIVTDQFNVLKFIKQ